ncbi:MAG: NUDIX domain-containing protein [Acidimicrobiia bacterium]
MSVLSVRTPSGATVERVVVEHPGAAAVVPLIDDDVLLVRQYRAVADESMLEIPAGKLDDPAENPRDAAHRELEEETGWVANDLMHLSTIWTAVGFSDEQIAIYLASHLTRGVKAPAGAEEEEAEIVRMPFLEAKRMVLDGEISDAKTVTGILLADQLRGSD